MRTAVFALLLCSSVGTATAGTLEDCTQDTDWWLRVQACTDAIASGEWEGRRASWAHSNRAVAYAALGNYIEAFDDHRQAVKLDPSNARARNNKANSHADFREYDRALREYNRAISLQPGYLNAHFNRAGVFMATSEFQAAIADYSVVLKDVPDFGDAYAGRAEARCRIEDTAASVDDRLAAIEFEALTPDEVTQYLIEKGYLTAADASGIESAAFRSALTAWTASGCP